VRQQYRAAAGLVANSLNPPTAPYNKKPTPTFLLTQMTTAPELSPLLSLYSFIDDSDNSQPPGQIDIAAVTPIVLGRNLQKPEAGHGGE
jgi:hypothetical protein